MRSSLNEGGWRGCLKEIRLQNSRMFCVGPWKRVVFERKFWSEREIDECEARVRPAPRVLALLFSRESYEKKTTVLQSTRNCYLDHSSLPEALGHSTGVWNVIGFTSLENSK